MLKYLEFLDHLERQLVAGRTLVDVARELPGCSDEELLSLEQLMDDLDLRIVDIVDEDVTMREIDTLKGMSDNLYTRLVAVGKLVSAS